MNSATAFIGNIPHQGKLKVHPTGSDKFIGFVEILWQPTGNFGTGYESATGMGSNQFMYFKEYEIIDSGQGESTLNFIDLEVNDPEELYRFDIAFLRIPPELIFLGAKDLGGGNWDLIPHRLPNEEVEMYSGLTMFNIHKEGDGSLADRSYIPPNHHLDTKDYSVATNAKCGCSKSSSFGPEQFPLFKKEGTSDYYILGVVTDNTICYFQSNSESYIIEATIELRKSTNTKIMGFAHHECIRYIVEEFKERFGVHILKFGGNTTLPGWEVGPWGVLAYSNFKKP